MEKGNILGDGKGTAGRSETVGGDRGTKQHAQSTVRDTRDAMAMD